MPVIDTKNNENWENWVEQCLKCKHCYTTKDDDYIKCRLRKGVCRFEEYRSVEDGSNNN